MPTVTITREDGKTEIVELSVQAAEEARKALVTQGIEASMEGRILNLETKRQLQTLGRALTGHAGHERG